MLDAQSLNGVPHVMLADTVSNRVTALESEHRRLFSKEIPSGKLEIDENKI
jgi:hypothetical protein